MHSSIEILKKTFGFTAFREHQEAIVHHILDKKDAFVLMPTGGGKSLCYQLPALMMEGLTMVISPLIALMKDQVDALRLNGVAAAYLNSSLSYSEQQKITRQLKANQLKLVYVAPERLMRTENEFFGFLKTINLSLIAIDEAHCISHWGHDFRPEYRMLSRLKKEFPHVPVIALTATADHLTRKDILEKLLLKNPATFISSFNRPNIRYEVEPKRDNTERLVRFLEQRKNDAGIIYCLSRLSTESLATQLQMRGFKALPYHAGLDKEIRTQHQEWFLKDEIRIIVATIAFGMGIDKSNVRFVIHMDMPKSIESYYQETGRAGRDGLESRALLFYSYNDVAKLKKFAEVKDNPDQTRINLQKLSKMAAYAELTVCRRKFLLNYFDEDAPDYCGNCDVCLSRVESIDTRTMNTSLSTEQSGHFPELMARLKTLRKGIADQARLPAYIVVSDATLMEVATYLPQTHAELSKISGFGEVKLEKYGARFLAVVNEYSASNGLASRIHLRRPKKPGHASERAYATRRESVTLFRKGITINEIARQRGLTASTIEGHLVHYIEFGEIAISDVVAVEKITVIEEVIRQLGMDRLAPLREALGEDYSFGEIRAVIAHLNFVNEKINYGFP